MRILSNEALVALQDYNQDIKDFIEWGDEPCTEDHNFEPKTKAECAFCWQSLKQLVEE